MTIEFTIKSKHAAHAHHQGTAPDMEGVLGALLFLAGEADDDTLQAIASDGTVMLDLAEVAEDAPAGEIFEVYTIEGYDPLDEPFEDDHDGMTKEQVQEIEAMIIAERDGEME